MLGNRVKVVREGAEPFEGTLISSNATGVVVHNQDGFNDKRLFIPYVRIIEIVNLGPVYR